MRLALFALGVFLISLPAQALKCECNITEEVFNGSGSCASAVKGGACAMAFPPFAQSDWEKGAARVSELAGETLKPVMLKDGLSKARAMELAEKDPIALVDTLYVLPYVAGHALQGDVSARGMNNMINFMRDKAPRFAAAFTGAGKPFQYFGNFSYFVREGCFEIRFGAYKHSMFYKTDWSPHPRPHTCYAKK